MERAPIAPGVRRTIAEPCPRFRGSASQDRDRPRRTATTAPSRREPAGRATTVPEGLVERDAWYLPSVGLTPNAAVTILALPTVVNPSKLPNFEAAVSGASGKSPDAGDGRDPRPTPRPVPPTAAPDEGMPVLVPVGRRLLHRPAHLLPGLEPPPLQRQRLRSTFHHGSIRFRYAAYFGWNTNSHRGYASENSSTSVARWAFRLSTIA